MCTCSELVRWGLRYRIESPLIAGRLLERHQELVSGLWTGGRWADSDGVLAAVSREEVHIEGSVPAMVPKEENFGYHRKKSGCLFNRDQKIAAVLQLLSCFRLFFVYLRFILGLPRRGT